MFTLVSKREMSRLRVITDSIADGLVDDVTKLSVIRMRVDVFADGSRLVVRSPNSRIRDESSVLMGVRSCHLKFYLVLLQIINQDIHSLITPFLPTLTKS